MNTAELVKQFEDSIANTPEFKAYAQNRMREIEAAMRGVPLEVLQDAKRRQDIEAHNTKIAAEKKQRKAMNRFKRSVAK